MFLKISGKEIVRLPPLVGGFPSETVAKYLLTYCFFWNIPSESSGLRTAVTRKREVVQRCFNVTMPKNYWSQVTSSGVTSWPACPPRCDATESATATTQVTNADVTIRWRVREFWKTVGDFSTQQAKQAWTKLHYCDSEKVKSSIVKIL